MHIQIRHRLIVLLAALLPFTGCTKEEEVVKAIEIVKSELHAGPEGGLCNAIVKAIDTFQAEVDADWCELEIKGDTLEVLCLPNHTVSERTAVITLSCLGETTHLAVSQDGQYASLLNIPENVTVGCGDIRLQYEITSNVSVSVRTDGSSWIRAGVSSTMVMVTLSANPDMEARDCQVIFSTSSKEVVLNIHQKGRFVLDCSEPVVFPKRGGEFSCEFYSAEPYTITSSQEWVKVGVEGDMLHISAAEEADLSPATAILTITTQSGYSRTIEVSQRLLPADYVGPFDFCFRSSWEGDDKMYEYAVDAEWDEEAGQIIFDLVSYVLRFDYDPADGQLYLRPQRAYVSRTQPYDTWLGIIGTGMLSDGSPDPSMIWPNETVTDWTNYYKEGTTFDRSARMLFKWDEGGLDRMTMTHCAESDFAIYRGREEGGKWYNEYGNPAYKVEDCYGFRLGLHHVYYNSMDDDRIDPDYMAFNHFPEEYRVDEHVSMYGPITLVRK
ncbi:MAG: hypothetical protein MJY86_07290 [Bacteroidales bacterium]|nr:hypothetical protein [Bacteroidales bacterium]